ncbi:MAG: hypothetical protein PUC50_05220 [Bacteroidales bacterium]|nr:hypothetical protein [Bacteroidales bacterium]
MPIIKLPTDCIVVIAITSSTKKTKSLNAIKWIYGFLKKYCSLSETNSLLYLDTNHYSFLDILEIPIRTTSSGKSISTKSIVFIAVNSDDHNNIDKIEGIDQCEVILFDNNITVNDKKLLQNIFGENIIEKIG